jgi:SHS2 domain-containing protein
LIHLIALGLAGKSPTSILIHIMAAVRALCELKAPMEQSQSPENPDPPQSSARAEHFAHAADIGVRGIGPSREAAFEQAAVALSEIVTERHKINATAAVTIECQAPSDALLLVDWLNALIYHMAVDRMLFSRFTVSIIDHRLHGEAWGEPVDRERHAPAVEPKGATYTSLMVERDAEGMWTAQCVVDV